MATRKTAATAAAKKEDGPDDVIDATAPMSAIADLAVKKAQKEFIRLLDERLEVRLLQISNRLDAIEENHSKIRNEHLERIVDLEKA